MLPAYCPPVDDPDPVERRKNELFYDLQSCAIVTPHGCLLYVAPRNPHRDLKFRGHALQPARIAAWVFHGGFDVLDKQVKVEHAQGCKSTCIEHTHLTVIDRPQESMQRPCPTCGAAPGVRCRGGRIHKLRRRRPAP